MRVFVLAAASRKGRGWDRKQCRSGEHTVSWACGGRQTTVQPAEEEAVAEAVCVSGQSRSERRTEDAARDRVDDFASTGLTNGNLLLIRSLIDRRHQQKETQAAGSD